MKARWFLYGILTLGLMLIAVRYTQAQESAPVNDLQPQNQDTSQEFMHNTQEVDWDNPNSASQPDGIEVLPTGLLNYQGQMLQNGSPISATLPITFSLYTVESGGSPWWQEMQIVQVDEGLFNVMLGTVNPLDNQAVNFQNQQWLGIQPEGAASELTPRQPLGVTAYAMNLMPGVTLVDENVGGPYGYSFWVSAEDHPAIYGRSDSSTGISGISTADNAPALYGSASGDGNGSHGLEGRMAGASASCPGGATECGSGLYATASGDAYASFLYGPNRSAIIAIQGDNGYYGLYLDSTIAPNGNGIWTNGASSFNDFVTFSAGKSGYVVDIALNDGSEVLEKGDVVAISGYDAPVVGKVPVVRVRKTSGANFTGVIGVVDVLYMPCQMEESLEIGQACGGFEGDITIIQPGEYLGVVTLGAFEALKVDAGSGPIRPGDLLATSTRSGYAMKATALTVEGVSFYAPGTIIGKALGSLDKGTGVIPVFVSSR